MNLETKRYKVIADYPNSKFKVEQVLHECEDMKGWYGVPFKAAMVGIDLDRFPNIFRPLAWYEERTAEEMPEYVKDRMGIVTKAPDWDNLIKREWLSKAMDHFGYTPATKDEYTEFIKNM